MLIHKRLKYSAIKTPFFCIKGIIVFLKLVNAGALFLLINNNFFNNKRILILKLVNFIFFKATKDEVGKKLLNCLIKLGPGYIKIGQALSTRPDLVGKKTCDYLKKLQDDITPFSGSIAKNIIETESQNLILNIFSSFNEIPIASASVAQVHTGILKSGEKVAIKLLKPNISKDLFKDFIFFYWAAKFFEYCLPEVRRLKLSKNVEVLSEVSLNELDLTMEASAADELAENFKNHTKYRVPKIFWEFTTKKMLVLEYIKGVRIDDINSLKKQNHDIKKITEVGAEVFFLQVFRDGYFHGDMHPGNILIDEAGSLIPIDFGIMGRLSNKDRQFLSSLLTHLLNKNYKEVVKIHYEAKMLGQDISHDQLSQAIRAISTPILNKPLGEVSLGKLLGQVLGLSKEFNIDVQPQFTLLQKTMLMAEGTTRQINPKINIWDLSGPLIERWINEAYDPFKTFEDWIHENKVALLKIPEIINKIDEIIKNK